MKEDSIRRELEEARRDAAAQKVIYLEGKTDVEPFFGLLGVARPTDDQHQGVAVKGLSDKGSGGTAVVFRVETAKKYGYGGIYGVLDGDGRSHTDLASRFDPPYAGPLFFWKAYCLENLLAKSGWPTAWGDPPDWNAELTKYAPYVALNRLHVELMKALETLGLERFSVPDSKLRTADEIREALGKGKHLIHGYDVETKFNEEHATFLGLIDSKSDELHARLNGKWLVTHLAPTRTRRSPDQVRSEWAEHARSKGGLAEVRELWQRITGNMP